MLFQARYRRLIEAVQQLLGDELPRERLDLVGAQPGEIGLVLPRRMDAADRQIAKHEQRERENLLLTLLAAHQQIAPEQPFRAAGHERAVDVEDRELHRFCPIGPRISSFWDRTNSITTGSPRITQITTARYTKP